MGRSSVVPARSSSLPTRPHPIPNGVERAISKLNSWIASSPSNGETMCVAIGGLVDLHDSIEELLISTPNFQQAITRYKGKQHVEVLLDRYVTLLDACNAMRDAFLNIKEHACNARSAIRRRGMNSTVLRDIEAYIRARKNTKRDVEKCIKMLKATENKTLYYFDVPQDSNISLAIINILVDATAVSLSVFRVFLRFLSTKTSTTKQISRWSLVSNALVHKRSINVGHQKEEETSELDNVDSSIISLHKNLISKEKSINGALVVQLAHSRLLALEKCVERLETGAEGIFRRLIQNRVSLLRTLSSCHL